MTKPNPAKNSGLIRKHTRREALCRNVMARGEAGLRAVEIVALDAFRQAQPDEMRTQVNQCIDLGLIEATNETGQVLHRYRDTDNSCRVILRITETGIRELEAPKKARSTDAGFGLISSPAKQRIIGIDNPLARPPLTRPGADDHRQCPSRSGQHLTEYTARP